VATAAELYELQGFDTLWLKVRRRLLQIQKQLGESEELQSARGAVADTEEQLHLWNGRQKDADLEFQALQKRIADTDEQLMSGRVTNPKELESLQASVDSLRRHASEVEDKGVEALLEIEALTEQLAANQGTLSKIETLWKAGQGNLLEEENKMKRNYVILKKRRGAAAQRMDADALAEYERLRKRKGGVAVTTVAGENCEACGVKLPTGVISAARSQPQLSFCTSCGRIVYGG
jgi:predicted  nucleic acid-binding Zn-ribbon protein